MKKYVIAIAIVTMSFGAFAKRVNESNLRDAQTKAEEAAKRSKVDKGQVNEASVKDFMKDLVESIDNSARNIDYNAVSKSLSEIFGSDFAEMIKFRATLEALSKTTDSGKDLERKQALRVLKTLENMASLKEESAKTDAAIMMRNLSMGMTELSTADALLKFETHLLAFYVGTSPQVAKNRSEYAKDELGMIAIASAFGKDLGVSCKAAYCTHAEYKSLSAEKKADLKKKLEEWRNACKKA